jgi:cyclophilin family peptidyl-prolyl cis-trans isomerase
MNSLRLSLVVGVLFSGLFAQAQTMPTATKPIGVQTLAVGAAPVSVDLRGVFSLPDVAGDVVQFDSVAGRFNVELRAAAAPRHVANFLDYVRSGAYANSFVHRAASFDGTAISIVQGGGYRIPIPVDVIAKNAPVALEYNLPNERGTLAAARTSEPDSATSEWFFNVRDNTSTLGAANGGGYSVFGRVIGSGMSVVDAMAALPRVNAGSPFDELPVRDYAGGSLSENNLVTITSITPVPVYPTGDGRPAVLSFSVVNSAPTVAGITLVGSAIAIEPRAIGTASVLVWATDTNGNIAETTFVVTVAAGPVFTTQPVSQNVAVGGSVVLSAGATGGTGYRWQHNGVDVVNATAATLTLSNVQPRDAGIYTAIVSDGSGAIASRPAIVGVTTNEKVTGDAEEVGTNIVHANHNVYDQVLLKGPAATVTADPGQVLRLSYVDLTDDIVQVEFSGAGTLSIVLDNATGPATPINYNQTIAYMKGHATIVIAGANETTNVSVFSVGRATAVNQALFRDDVSYDGMADIALLAISSTNGHIAGVRTANTRYLATRGLTGVYAPNVQIDGPLYVGDVVAADRASPMLVTAGVGDARVTGGDLLQANARSVQIEGLTQLLMDAGTDSNANPQPPLTIRGRLELNGADVTDAVAQMAN